MEGIKTPELYIRWRDVSSCKLIILSGGFMALGNINEVLLIKIININNNREEEFVVNLHSYFYNPVNLGKALDFWGGKKYDKKHSQITYYRTMLLLMIIIGYLIVFTLLL
ncbi:MAG: hypothetical protein E7076_01530 [Bacteroidales bacterium]|nr:hypothetical protein [Bacteroidales bacterium]